eukprot:evm.model.NODE_41503_length_12158_cov_22.054943.2
MVELEVEEEAPEEDEEEGEVLLRKALDMGRRDRDDVGRPCISAFIPLSNANNMTALSPLPFSLPSSTSKASVASPHTFTVTGITTSPRATTLCGT